MSGTSYVTENNRLATLWLSGDVAEQPVVTMDQLVEESTFPIGTSAQKAAFIALTRALELSNSVVFNVYTNSRFAYGVVDNRTTK